MMWFTGIAQAQPDASADVQTAWRLLDYIAVDYAGAVSDGRVTSEAEYAEQVEFAATVATKLKTLPDKPGRASLLAQVAQLQTTIGAKAASPQVAENARALAAALLAVYPVPLAPTTVPSLERGATLYRENCAACHGATGDGLGLAAKGLQTPPIAFTDVERARQRSVFALYQVITQGVDDTPMASYAKLPAADRWALAFYSGQFALPDAAAKQGEQAWKNDAAARAAIPDLKTLVGLTPQALETRLGEQKADALMAYLRRHPEAVTPQSTGSLTLVRERLGKSVEVYRTGDHRQAGELALSAYLDGFEPVEPILSAHDAALLDRIEGAMGEYRAAIARGDDANEIQRRANGIEELLVAAETALSPEAASSVSTFIGSATVLLREGLEALLIVVAMIAFLRKAERTEAMPYVHAGWIGALLAGLATWAVATWLIGISGANRELVEGFGSVFAAVVLLSIGIWMHGKSQADQWQRYIREKMSKALTGRSAWFLFGLAFVVVYREVFETILFYAALWTQGNGTAMLAGAGTACVVLALVAWAMLRYSKRLPIAQFFRYSAWLMAGLTVVLAGKGIAALQEAGVVGLSPLNIVPRISTVGLYPTAQTLIAQLVLVVILVVGFRHNRQHAARA